jgi:ectoine hydroxylase-related dioxygenase (phytanoyl-CoA dioxygenase family)
MHPGSHKSGVIFRMRQPSPPPESPLPEGQTLPDQEVAQVTTFPPSTSSDTESDAAPLEIEAYDVSRDPDAGVPIEMTAGTVIFVNGYTLQRLLPNTSSYVLRRALKIHYCSAETLLPWTMDGVVPMTADNRDIVMIAGKDPYAYKGTAEHAVARAHMKHTE